MTASTDSRKPIGVGIVGLSAGGGWGSRGHVPALQAVEGYELRGLAASSAQSAERAAEAYGVPAAYSDVSDLARDENIDLVVIAVRVPRHRELILPVLRAGKAVLSEWPLATDLEQAEELALLAEQHGVRTAVGLQSRSAPAVRYLRDLVADGYVGEVLSTTLLGSGGGWGPAVGSNGAYTVDRSNGATLMTIPFGHTLDALTMCLSPFTELSATTATRRPTVQVTDTGESIPMTAEDQIAVSGRLTSGAVASLHYRGGSSRATNLHWEINGTDGDLVVSGNTGHLQFGRFDISGARGEEKQLAPLPVPAQYQDVAGVEGPAAVVAHAYAHLREDLHTGSTTVPDFRHAVEHHRLLDRIARSAETGTRQ